MSTYLSEVIYKSCEEIDAAMFSGDEFYDRDCLREIKQYIERWSKQIVQIENLIAEGEADEQV